jgi:hypothetical protein
VVDDLDAETHKFDFAGIHAAEIHPFFHRNDGQAAERVADALAGVRDRRAPFVSLSSVLRGTRPNPSLGQIAKGAASLLFGSAATERLRTRFNPARREKRIEPSDVKRLLAQIAVHDQADPSSFSVERARCARTGLPLASITIQKRSARA